MSDPQERALIGLERHGKAITGVLRDLVAELRSVGRALAGIHETLKESNRARDKWARAVVEVLEDAKEGTSDEDNGADREGE